MYIDIDTDTSGGRCRPSPIEGLNRCFRRTSGFKWLEPKFVGSFRLGVRSVEFIQGPCKAYKGINEVMYRVYKASVRFPLSNSPPAMALDKRPGAQVPL